MRPPRSPFRTLAALGLLLLPWSPGPGLAAQSAPITVGADRFGVKAPRPPVSPGTLPPVAAEGCTDRQIEPVLPPVPKGRGGNPQPKDPPAVEADPRGQRDIGQFVYFKNALVQPAGARRSTASTITPSCVNVQDTVLQTGNWYAALSRDSGQTWTNLDPATFFPAPDGGFCCNQRVEYVPSHDIALWLLQYGYSATTGKGSYQLAVANGRDELRSGNAADWTLYTFDPTDFGFALPAVLDTPDIAFNNDWLYLSSNVINGATFLGAVVWRISLQDLRNNGNVTFSYETNAVMGGHSYRFANRAGDGTNMYWGTLLDTTTLRVWRQNTIGIQRDYVDVTTAAWQNSGTAGCQGPDGRDWLGSAVGRIRGACGTASELVFAWASHGNGGNRPYPYTRVTRLRVSNRTLLGEHDVYNIDRCWAYMALDSNTLGHVGGVVAIGGPSIHVRTSAFVIDGYDAWSGVTAFRVGDPTNNPPGQAFGHYFDVQRSSVDARTFIGTGNLMVGGDQQAHVETRHLWFGRDDYQPSWARLEVNSTPVQGVAVTLDATDISGQRNGTTNLVRNFVPGQGVEVDAPARPSLGGTEFQFQRWVLNATPQPEGQRKLVIRSLGSAGATAEARYLAVRSIRFEASGHLTVPVAVQVPPDLDGNGNGRTVFTRRYLQTSRISITLADPLVQGHPFKAWVINGNRYPLGQQTVDFTLGGANVTATAEFYERTPGAFRGFGTGCAGSNGIDVHSGGGTPETNQTLQWRLQGAPGLSAAVLLLGASNTSWGGIPLPVPVPGGGDCLVRVSVDVTLPTSTNASGDAAILFAVPGDVALIGARVFTQYATVDLPANQLGLTLSNGLETLVGGLR